MGKTSLVNVLLSRDKNFSKDCTNIGCADVPMGQPGISALKLSMDGLEATRQKKRFIRISRNV